MPARLLLVLLLPGACCEMCSRPADLGALEPRYQVAFTATDADFVTTLADYQCTEVVGEPCTKDSKGNFQGHTINYIDDDDHCKDRLGTEKYWVNCVDCGFRCECPQHFYLLQIDDGRCWPTEPELIWNEWRERMLLKSWPNIDRCGEWDQCGFFCKLCPAGKYRFNEGVEAFVEGNDAYCKGESCCTVDPTGRGEALDDLYVDETEAFQDASTAQDSFKAAVEAVSRDTGVPGWEGIWRTSETELQEVRVKTGAQLGAMVDPYLGEQVSMCGATHGGLPRDQAAFACGEQPLVSADPCYFSRQASTMTLALIPYSSRVPEHTRHNLYMPIDDTVGAQCDPCQTMVKNFDEGAFRIECLDRFFAMRLVENYCTNCEQVEAWQALVDDYDNSSAAYTTGDRILTYTTECKAFLDGEMERLMLSVGEIPLAVLATPWWFATNDWRANLWSKHRTNEFRCESFRHGNPGHFPIKIKCGPEETYLSQPLPCQTIVLDGLASSYYTVPEPTYAKVRLKVGVVPEQIPLQSERLVSDYERYGLKAGCMINRDNWSLNACDLVRRSKLGACYDFHDEIYNELGAKRTQYVDYFDTLRTVEAHDRRAFVLFAPNLPKHSYIETYTDTACVDRRRSVALHNPDLEEDYHIVELGMDYTETVDEDYMQAKWDATTNREYFEKDREQELYYTGGAPPVGFVFKQLDELPDMTPQDNEKSFRISIPDQYKCECAYDEEFILPGDGYSVEDLHFFDKLGFVRCRPCPLIADGNRDSYRYILVPHSIGVGVFACGRVLKKCYECESGTFPNAALDRCVDCRENPVRINNVKFPTYPELDITTGRYSCAICNTPGHFLRYKQEWDDLEFDSCEPLPRMEVVFSVDSGSTRVALVGQDLVVEDYTLPHITRPVKAGHYLDLDTQTELSCVNDHDIDDSTYRSLCGRGRFLVRFPDATGDDSEVELEPGGDSKAILLLSNSERYEIMRAGVVKSCKRCDAYHYQSGKCSDDGDGFPGTCTQCTFCSHSETALAASLISLGVTLEGEGQNCANRWLWHELDTGCNIDGRAEVIATTDYEFRDCEKVLVDQNGAFILLGCGTIEPYKWKCDSTNRYGVCVEWPALEESSTGDYFQYYHEVDTDDTHTKARFQFLAELQGAYRPYLEKIPYCPPRHFFRSSGLVDKFEYQNCALCTPVCSTGGFTADAIRGSLELCKHIEVDQIKDGTCISEASDNAVCIGFEREDTQKRCTRGCDIGYYQKFDSYPTPAVDSFQNGTSRCVRCETCGYV